MKPYKFFMPVAALALAVGFCACSDDDEAYTPGFEGVEGQVVLAPTVNATFKVVKTPSFIVAPDVSAWGCSPRSRIIAPEDVAVHFEVDYSLVDDYNAENATYYQALPEGIVTMAVSDATIATGNFVADAPVTIAITDNQQQLAQMVVGQRYLVPVRMTAVTKGSARLAVSTDNVSYLIFFMSEEMLNPGGIPTGTLVPVDGRSGWTITPGDGASEWMGWTSPLNETSYSYGSYPEGSTVTVDLGKAYTFDGINCAAYYDQTSYALFRAGTEVLTSNDGANWTSLGSLAATVVADLAFYAPVTAQYIKFVMGSGRYVAVTSFSIYEK